MFIKFDVIFNIWSFDNGDFDCLTEITYSSDSLAVRNIDIEPYEKQWLIVNLWL